MQAPTPQSRPHPPPHHPRVVIIGASPIAVALRRTLLQRSIDAIGVSGRLTGLRRSLVTGRVCPAAICISLDAVTLERHGGLLRSLLTDRHGMPFPMGCVGVLPTSSRSSRMRDVMTLGCDLYLDDCETISRAIELLGAQDFGRGPRSWAGRLAEWTDLGGLPPRLDDGFPQCLDRSCGGF